MTKQFNFITLEEAYYQPKLSEKSAMDLVQHILPDAKELFEKFGTPIKETIERVVVLSRKLQRESKLKQTKEYLFKRIEQITEERYQFTEYQNSVELSNKNESYAIFVRNGWIYFSDKFKASSIESFLKRLQQFVDKMYEIDYTIKAEQVISHVIKTSKQEGVNLRRSDFLNFSTDNGLNIILEGECWVKVNKVVGTLARVQRKTNMSLVQKIMIAGIQIMSKELSHMNNFGIRPHKVIPDKRAPSLFRVKYSPMYC